MNFYDVSYVVSNLQAKTITIRRGVPDGATTSQILSYYSLPIIIVIGLVAIGIIAMLLLIKPWEDKERFDINYEMYKDYPMLYNIVNETSQYYRINRKQIKIIFIVSVITCSIGLIVLIIGIFISINKGLDVESIISGVLIEFVSATFFFMYKQCASQGNIYYNKLNEMRNILIAIDLANSMNDEDKRDNNNIIIGKLMNLKE